MSPTPLPSLRKLFPSKRHRPPFTSAYGGLTSLVDFIRPRSDDLIITSRPITPQLVLDRGSPRAYARSERHSPMAPVPPSLLGRESDPGHGPATSEVSCPIDPEDIHNHKTRKHVCHHCGKRFNRPSSLTIHYHTHTGERRKYHSLSLFHSLE